MALTAVAMAGVRCAHFNGLYNARAASARADDLRARGLEDSASVWYDRAAQSAEFVLARSAGTTSEHEARLLAGRGLAMSGVADPSLCDRAAAHLTAFARSEPTTSADRWRAELAMGVCDVRLGRFTRGATRLQGLETNPVAAVPPADRREAVRWRARAALGAGDAPLADSLLQSLGTREARWDRLAAARSAENWRLVETLLLEAAADADVRPALYNAIEAADAAGQRGVSERIIDAYEIADIARRDQAQLLLLSGALARARGDTARARVAYVRVTQRLATGLRADSAWLQAATVGQLAMDIGNLGAANDSGALVLRLRALLFAASPAARGSVAYEQLASAVALYAVLAASDDSSGAGAYLSGEVARDSLKASGLASATWRALTERWPIAPLAPRALYAAALLDQVRADSLQSVLLARYPATPMADVLRAETVRDGAAQRRDDGLLAGRWIIARREQEDTLRAWRARGLLSAQALMPEAGVGGGMRAR